MALLEIVVIFFLLALAGLPLVYAILTTTVGYIAWKSLSHPIESILLTYIGGVEPFVLIAVPLFIVAGELLSRGGVGERIMRFARTLFGWCKRSSMPPATKHISSPTARKPTTSCSAS